MQSLHAHTSYTNVLLHAVCNAGMGTQWAGMGRSLMQLPDFRDSILRSDAALKETGLVVSRLLMEAQEDTFEDTVHAFVGLAAVQVQRCSDAASQREKGSISTLVCFQSFESSTDPCVPLRVYRRRQHKHLFMTRLITVPLL